MSSSLSSSSSRTSLFRHSAAVLARAPAMPPWCTTSDFGRCKVDSSTFFKLRPLLICFRNAYLESSVAYWCWLASTCFNWVPVWICCHPGEGDGEGEELGPSGLVGVEEEGHQQGGVGVEWTPIGGPGGRRGRAIVGGAMGGGGGAIPPDLDRGRGVGEPMGRWGGGAVILWEPHEGSRGWAAPEREGGGGGAGVPRLGGGGEEGRQRGEGVGMKWHALAVLEVGVGGP